MTQNPTQPLYNRISPRFHVVKIALSVLCFIAVSQLFAQNSTIPQKFNYSTQITDTLGVPISNKQVSMQNTLTVGSPTGTVVYSETNTGVTNAMGIITVVIGGGIITQGSVGSVPWTSAPVYFSTAIDVNGGTNFAPVGAAQLVSYPYSLAAGNGVNTVGFDTTGKTLVKTADGLNVLTSSTGAWLTSGNSGLNGTGAFIGTNDSTDVVFKANGNEGMRLSASGNVGVGVAPVTAMDINGALSLRSTSISAGANTTININNRSLFLINVTANHASCTFTNGLVTGQLLMLVVSVSNNGWSLTLNPSSNLRLPASNETLKDGATVTFVWTGTTWLQTSISNNN